MAGIARTRLAQERKNWRKDRPMGFVAKPMTRTDGSTDMMTWECMVPGKEGTHWQGGRYPVTMRFNEDYPNSPPECSFPPGFFHPNVFPDGRICLSIINDYQDWKPSISMKQILVGIQELLHNPSILSPAQEAAEKAYKNDMAGYTRRVKAQTKRYTPKDEG
eukprot:jgi/Chrzof1/409/Cz01g14230.t1